MLARTPSHLASSTRQGTSHHSMKLPHLQTRPELNLATSRPLSGPDPHPPHLILYTYKPRYPK